MLARYQPIFSSMAAGRISFAQLVLLVFPFLFIYQNPQLKDYFDISPGPKIYHYFLPLFFLAFLFRGRRRRLAPVAALAAVVLLNVLVTRLISQQLATFVLFCMTCVAAAAVSDENDDWFRVGCGLAIAAIVLNMVLHIPEILSSGADNAEDRAIYPTLLAAGVNIELSTLVLLLIYVAPRWIAGISVLVFFLYAVFGTRAVLLIWCVYVALAHGAVLKAGLRRHFFSLLAAGALAAGAFAVFWLDQFEFTFLDRVLQIGKDPGSIGRLMLYEVAFSSSDCFAFGCGLGSAQELIRHTRIANFFEDNFHNVYLQLLVEIGVPGLCAYLALWWRGVRKGRASGDTGLYVCLFAIGVLSLIQFTGYEIITAYFLGRALHDPSQAGLVDHRVHAQHEPLHGEGLRQLDVGGR